VIRIDFSVRVTFEQSLEIDEELSHVAVKEQRRHPEAVKVSGTSVTTEGCCS
jgi:hypothetical protein